MSDVNVVVISGTMGKISVKAVTFGEEGNKTTSEVASFGIMSVDTYKNREKKTIARCSAWGEVVREVGLLSEGDTVIVQGKIASRKDKDDKWVMEVSVSKISLLAGARRTEPLPF
jgi:single-stranded DNA-binding protein